jgi:hypothetical protein
MNGSDVQLLAGRVEAVARSLALTTKRMFGGITFLLATFLVQGLSHFAGHYAGISVLRAEPHQRPAGFVPTTHGLEILFSPVPP